MSNFYPTALHNTTQGPNVRHDERIRGTHYKSCKFLAMTFIKCVFANTRFDGCDLLMCTFIDCEFFECVFDESDLEGCMFRNCIFTKCDFEGEIGYTCWTGAIIDCEFVMSRGALRRDMCSFHPDGMTPPMQQ